MGKIVMVSKGRNINASMQNDIVTENEKNLSNWTNTCGADISFDEGVNTIIFENKIKPTLKELVYQKTGYTLNDAAASTIQTDMGNNPTWVLYYTEDTYSACRLWLINCTSETATRVAYSNGICYVLSKNGSILSIDNRVTNIGSGNIGNVSWSVKFVRIGIYNDINGDQTLPTYNQLISALGLNSAYSPENYYNQFMSAANTKFGENNYNILAIKMNYWNTMHTCFIFAYNKILPLQKLTNGSYGGINYAFAYFPNGVQQNFDNVWWTTECDYSGGNGVSSTNPYIYIGNFYSGAGIQLEKAWKAPFSGNINKTFVVEDGKKYYLKFNEYTTSGFVNTSTDNVIITSGSNEQKLTLDNDIAETPKEYNTMITGNGTNLNIKFDLETMKSTSTITLKISDVQIYKIGS